MSVYSAHTDEQLLSLLRNSDADAFTALYNRYWAGIFRHVMKITRSQSEAEDIVQELFESVWKRRKQLAVRGSFSAYLHTGAKYMAIHFIEKNIADQAWRRSLSDALDRVSMPAAESAVDAKALEARIDELVGRLPEKMREVFRLSRKEHLTHREIAERLHISEQTVKKQVYNSLKFLREHLGDAVPLGCLIMTVYAISL